MLLETEMLGKSIARVKTPGQAGPKPMSPPGMDGPRSSYEPSFIDMSRYTPRVSTSHSSTLTPPQGGKEI